MAEPEQLEKSQPAEIHIDGIPQYAGEVSMALDQGLVLTDTRPMRGKLSGALNIHVGTNGDLVFLKIFDDDVGQFVIPITFEGPKDTNLLAKLRTDIKIRSAPSAEETNELLPELRKRSLDQLDRLINDYLMALADHLFDLSSRPTTRDEQEDLHEAMNQIKRAKDEIRNGFKAAMTTFFDDLVAKESDTPKSDELEEDLNFAELNLVDIQDFEDSLSIDRMIKTGQESYSTQLECLTVRYAELVNMDPLELRLPMHISQVCNAFHTSLAERELPHDVIPEVYSFSADRVVRKLDPFYTRLNTYLREQGVTPYIEQEVKKHGTVLKKLAAQKHAAKRKPQPADEEPAASELDGSVPSAEESGQLLEEARQSGIAPALAAGGSEAAAGMPGVAATDGSHGSVDTGMGGLQAGADGAGGGPAGSENLYRSVIDALNFRRSIDAGHSISGGGTYAPGGGGGLSTSSGGPTGHAPAGDKPADAATVARALAPLQGDRNALSQLQQHHSLRQYLEDNQASIAELQDSTGFAPEGMDQLDLVDNLFQSIRSDVDVTPELQAGLGNLHIPLAKLSLLEPQFFLDPDHPGRGVVDKLTQPASSANCPNRALENRVNNIIDNIVDNYETDSSVFNTALQGLNKLVTQQEAALQRNIERVVKAQNGKEKLSKAQQAVDKILNSCIRPPKAPRLMVDLVDHAWREMLVLTHVKDGPGSKTWKDFVKTLSPRPCRPICPTNAY